MKLFSLLNNLLLLGGGGHRTGECGGGYGELLNFVDKKYPNAKVKYKFATQDTITLDSMPYVGKYSDLAPDILVATGFNKWGMTGSMLAARLLADEIIGCYNEYSELLSPSRPMRKMPLLKNVLSSCKGLITLKRPRCTHLGCALSWNSAEHSWDCSCHGSRFSASGKLMENPAIRDADIDDTKK